MVREVPLTRGLVALVDDEDFERVSRFRWHVTGVPPYAYATTNIRTPEGNKRLRLHRFLVDAPAGVLVDHADGNTLDCRRRNLRIATYAQNAMNSRRAPARFGFKGVTGQKGRSFVARICAHGVKIRKCGFRTPEAAARAYDEMARELHGEFAVLNFPHRKAA